MNNILILLLFPTITMFAALKEIIEGSGQYLFTVGIVAYMIILMYLCISYKKKNRTETEIYLFSTLLSVLSMMIYGVAISFIYIYNEYESLVSILLIVIGINIILSIYFWKFSQYFCLYVITIILRFYFILVSIIILLLLLSLYIITFFNSLGSPFEKFDAGSPLCFMVGGVLIYYLLNIFMLFYWKIIKRIHIFNFKSPTPILLFLRPFKYDQNNQYERILNSLDLIFGASYNIIQIGNPKFIFRGYETCHTLYLHSANWKKNVREYIEVSSMIFLVLDGTNGVFWEMLNHADMIHKYIFYLPQNIDISNLINHETFKKHMTSNNAIAKHIFNASNELKKSTFFFIDKNILYKNSDIFLLVNTYCKVNIYLPNARLIEKESEINIGNKMYKKYTCGVKDLLKDFFNAIRKL